MASNFIVIDRADANAIFASDLVSAVSTMDQLYARLEKISNKMAEMVDGADYSQIETLFGVPVGTGQALKTIVDDLLAGLATGNADVFRSRLG